IVSSLLIAGAKNLGLDWQGLWILSGIASLIGLLLCAILVPPIQSPNVAAQANDGVPRRLRLLILSYGFVGFGYIITATFISTIVRMEPTVRWLEVPIWMIVGLGAAFSVAVWMKVSAWISLKSAYVLAASIAAISVALTAFADNPVLLIVGSFAFGLCFMAVTAFGFMLAREAAPGSVRQAIGIMTVAFGVGQAIGPWFAGVIVEQTGSFTVPTLTAAVALMLSSILGGLWQPREG
ncbi:MAG: YbfB/YjiJ family MFS transporter, partial [Pseudomonadota bacterium]